VIRFIGFLIRFTGFVFVRGNQGSPKYSADVDYIGEVGAGEGSFFYNIII
jgi:hypothetical protein